MDVHCRLHILNIIMMILSGRVGIKVMNYRVNKIVKIKLIHNINCIFNRYNFHTKIFVIFILNDSVDSVFQLNSTFLEIQRMENVLVV